MRASIAISRLSELAESIEPAPASLALFGSFARGTDDAGSDLDVLVVRPDDLEPTTRPGSTASGPGKTWHGWSSAIRSMSSKPHGANSLFWQGRDRSGGPSSMTPSRSLVRSPSRSLLRCRIRAQSFPRLSRVRRPAGSRIANQGCKPPNQSHGQRRHERFARWRPSERRRYQSCERRPCQSCEKRRLPQHRSGQGELDDSAPGSGRHEICPRLRLRSI